MTRPNFVIVLCDDLGYGDLGCYGSDLNRTPRLDAMAAEGMRFTDFYMAASVCSPSRAAILTGCYPKRIGLATGHDFCVLLPGDPIGLHPDEVSLAKVLKAEGYATKLIGKWHLGDQPPFLPTRHGFDSYFGLPYSNDMLPDHPWSDRFAFPPLPLMRDDRVVQVDPNQASLTDHYAREAVSFIRQHQDRPFFLYLSHMYVHVPIYAPFRYLCSSHNGPYGAAVEHLDYTTGLLLDTLAEAGIDDRTLVVFTSDNGSIACDGASNGPLRGCKGTTWEGGMRVPCIMRWPGKIPAGSVCTELATAMDLMPTLADLAGGTLPANGMVDGSNLRPLIFRDPGAPSPHDAFYYYQENNLNAVRSRRWKLHLQENVLVDLASDIGETTDLSAVQPGVVARLQELADVCRKDMGDGRLGIAGENCRPAGRVDKPKTLTSPELDDPYLAMAYD